ncbi:MAG: flagellar hook-basal body complex protein [Limnohabitans sp.]|jgi:flagellar hook-basal body protein|nr:flagellar hook-basal body complex protein [Limnohabitans sp.]
MSFFTALTGLNAATAQLAVTSNNIANAGTVGFKRSRADFGDIFATSPLQKATSTIGQGVSLKGVKQEFSQGNVSFSSNTLDLAITGDGFFPLKSADGFQDIYTRNGAFMMNDQYNVVNSAGQRLMAASVDSSGKANLTDQNVLTIPQKTTGQASETSLIKLGLNFPADAKVIDKTFNRNDPTTYNKSTALTVYDKGGNGYLATVYYAKTQNASANKPTNKWQTYVYIGDSLVSASLQQSTNATGEKMYVNKYGQLKPESEVSDFLVNSKTQKFSLDDLTDVRTSVPASVMSNSLPNVYPNADEQGANFSYASAQEYTDLINGTTDRPGGLKEFMTISVDGSKDVTLDMSQLAGKKLTGTELAKALTNELNYRFGDERYFDMSSMQGAATPNNIVLSYNYNTKGEGQPDLSINLSDLETSTIDGTPIPAGDTTMVPAASNASKIRTNDLVQIIQARLDKAVQTYNTANPTATIPTFAVAYDPVARGFTFKGTTDITGTMGIKSSQSTNSIFGLSTTMTDLNKTTGGYPGYIGPNGDFIQPADQQRYGLKVEFDTVKQNFKILSGTTGDTSTIHVTVPKNGWAQTFMGLDVNTEVKTTADAVRGIPSTPASIIGSPVQINVNNNFTVDITNNKFVVAVDDVKGTVELPVGNTYTLDSFMSELEKRINQLSNDSGSTVCGVKVQFDRAKNAFTFTTGTATSNSFIKVSGSATWGLANLEAGRGTTTTWVKPTQYTEMVDGVSVAKYIDEFGKETASADGFKALPAWSPVYLDRGELTFDTGGNLVSPKGGSQLDTVYLADGKGALTINIDYSKSTQFSSPYAVLSQSQDGAPEGDLVGLSIKDDGLVTASYSNGSQQSLGKVVLVNFSNPSGLRQIGDSSFYASSESGKPKIGEAGSAGYGTVRAGATERANVDLTTELVDLITAQRNFQANAKAIETNTTLTQTIIQIRA